QEMLPLIRTRRPNRFRLLHDLAFKYFHSRVSSDSADRTSCAEAIYHGLWLGVPLEDLDRLWPKTSGFEPRLDPDEFAQMPEANRYIRAKTRLQLTVDDIKALPPSMAIEWLVSRDDILLDDDHPNDIARIIAAAAGNAYEGLDDHISRRVRRDCC